MSASEENFFAIRGRQYLTVATSVQLEAQQSILDSPYETGTEQITEYIPEVSCHPRSSAELSALLRVVHPIAEAERIGNHAPLPKSCYNPNCIVRSLCYEALNECHLQTLISRIPARLIEFHQVFESGIAF